LQRKSEPSLLVVFLQNDNLVDSVFETQSLTNLRSQLDIDIKNLNDLHTAYNNKVTQVNTKKGSIDTHQKSLAVRKDLVEEQKQDRNTILTQTKSKESTYQQQLAELQKQQDAVSEEIGKFEEQLRATFDASLLPMQRPGVFGWPIQMKDQGGVGIITQHYGEISYLYKYKPHNGLDIGAPVGTPVLAAEAGTVIAVDNNDRSAWSRYQYGKYILIKHENNLTTLYAHLSSQSVRVGATVTRGQVIGYVGKTGYATGAHLHFGVYWAPSISLKSIPPAAGLVPVGVVVQPEDYL
jgi:murein DD-endopeptidase MepM/ murein hydrolase activator NlpD